MYKNVPAINKNAQLVKNWKLPINKPTNTPIRHNIPDTVLKTRARFNETPALRNTAKSPISWGSSWHNTAIAVPKPVDKPEANEAPIARPSAKLCKLKKHI